MKATLVLCLLLSLGGCSDKPDAVKSAIRELGEGCNGRLSVTLTISNWNDSLTFHCDDVEKGLTKNLGKGETK